MIDILHIYAVGWLNNAYSFRCQVLPFDDVTQNSSAYSNKYSKQKMGLLPKQIR